jgi:hypothetical protein
MQIPVMKKLIVLLMSSHAVGVRRSLAVIFILLTGIGTIHAGQAVSIILKPQKGITGTTAFNLHDDGNMTLLVYESPTRITESPVAGPEGLSGQISSLAVRVFAEYAGMDDYTGLPDGDWTCAVSITHDGVTKSVSTRRFSAKLAELLNLVDGYMPQGAMLELDQSGE